MEMLGQNSHLWKSMMDKVCNGPSDLCDHKFTIESYALGGKYVDDDLSVEELNLISGVVKVYTGNTNLVRNGPLLARTINEEHFDFLRLIYINFPL